jgi:hypothetical protein
MEVMDYNTRLDTREVLNRTSIPAERNDNLWDRFFGGKWEHPPNHCLQYAQGKVLVGIKHQSKVGENKIKKITIN